MEGDLILTPSHRSGSPVFRDMSAVKDDRERIQIDPDSNLSPLASEKLSPDHDPQIVLTLRLLRSFILVSEFLESTKR